MEDAAEYKVHELRAWQTFFVHAQLETIYVWGHACPGWEDGSVDLADRGFV